MSKMNRKFRFDPKDLSTQKMFKACRDMVTRIRTKTEDHLGDHCCPAHRLETLQTSIIVTGFMQMAGEVQRQTGPIQVSVLDQAFRTIAADLTGAEIPAADMPEGAVEDGEGCHE